MPILSLSSTHSYSAYSTKLSVWSNLQAQKYALARVRYMIDKCSLFPKLVGISGSNSVITLNASEVSISVRRRWLGKDSMYIVFGYSLEIFTGISTKSYTGLCID